MTYSFTDPAGTYWWNGEQCNFLVTDDYFFIAYYTGSTKYVKVARIARSDGTTTYATIGTLGDGHETPSVILLDNKLVCVRGSYGDTGVANDLYAKYAVASGDYNSITWNSFSGWSNIPLAPNGTMGYVMPKTFADGTVLMPACERSGNNYTLGSDMYFFKKTPEQTFEQGTWTKLISAPNTNLHFINSAQGNYSPAVYESKPILRTLANGTERLGIIFGVMNPNDAYTYDTVQTCYEGVGYIYTDDKGATWHTVDGAQVTLPIQTATKSSPLWLWTGGSNLYNGLDFTDDGTPIIAVDTFTTSTVSPVSRLTYGLRLFTWNGSAWQSAIIEDDQPALTEFVPGGMLQAPKVIVWGSRVFVPAFSHDGTNQPYQRLKVYEYDTNLNRKGLTYMWDDGANASRNICFRAEDGFVARTQLYPNWSTSGAAGDTVVIDSIDAIYDLDVILHDTLFDLDVILNMPPTGLPLYIGSQQVQKVYVGNNEVIHMYKGNTLIF